MRRGIALFLAALVFFMLFSPGFEPGEAAIAIKGAAYFIHHGRFASGEAQAGEPTIGPGKVTRFKHGGPILFVQLAGAMWVIEWLIQAFGLYPVGSSEYWSTVGFGLSFLPALWSALTLLGVWLALGAVGVTPRHRLLVCALLGVTSHQLPLTKTAYDGLFLGTVGIFAVWCGLLARARRDGGAGFVALAGLLWGLGFATKTSGVLLGFPLALLVLTLKAPIEAKVWRALLLGGGFLFGLAARIAWNLVIGEGWRFLTTGVRLDNWATGLGGYSLERISVYLFSPALSIFVHAPTLLLLFVFGWRLYRAAPLLYTISAGTLVLSVGLHSQNLGEFLVVQNFSGRFSVWVLPIAYLALGHLPRAVPWERRVTKGGGGGGGGGAGGVGGLGAGQLAVSGDVVDPAAPGGRRIPGRGELGCV